MPGKVATLTETGKRTAKSHAYLELNYPSLPTVTGLLLDSRISLIVFDAP